MYSKHFNDGLKKLVIMDKDRINKLGKLIQNSFLYIIFTLIIALIINDIFPPFDNFKNKSIILGEVILQILLLSIFIFYLQKVVLLFPYIFDKFTNSSNINQSSSIQYSEIIIITIIIISTQGQLLKKINYLFLHLNNKSTEYDLNILNTQSNGNNDQKIIKYCQDKNIKINIQDNNHKIKNDDSQNKVTNLNLTKYDIPNNDKKNNHQINQFNNNDLIQSNENNHQKDDKGTVKHFLKNLQNNISALEAPSHLHYSSYYLPSQDSKNLSQNYRNNNHLESLGIREQFTNNDQVKYNNVEQLFKQQNQNMNDKIENLSNRINDSSDLLSNNNLNMPNKNSSSYIVPTSPTIKKKLIEDFFPKNNNNEYSTSLNDLHNNYNSDINKLNLNNNNLIKIPDYNSLMNEAHQNKI